MEQEEKLYRAVIEADRAVSDAFAALREKRIAELAAALELGPDDPRLTHDAALQHLQENEAIADGPLMAAYHEIVRLQAIQTAAHADYRAILQR